MPRTNRENEPRGNNINTQITDEAAKELAAVRFGMGRGFLQEFLSRAIMEEAERLKRMKAVIPRTLESMTKRQAKRLGWVIVQDMLANPELKAAWQTVGASERRALAERWTALLLETATKALEQPSAPVAASAVPA